MRLISHRVDETSDGWPVWRVLEERLRVSGASMRRAKAQPDSILLDGIPVRSTMPVRAGQVVSLDISDRAPSRADGMRDDAPAALVEPQDGPLDIIYEDEDLLVVNKAAGEVVHPCPGHREHTIGNHVLAHLRRRGLEHARLHPVHRLDLGTSGLLVFATSSYAQERLQAQAHDGFDRRYLAICQGDVTESVGRSGVIDAPIARVSPTSIRRAVDPAGQDARTWFEVVLASREVTLLELRLETGRTHQIRVHLAHVGHPLVGDALYGCPHEAWPGPSTVAPMIDRPALHSWKAGFVHPVTQARVELEAPLPDDMRSAIDALGIRFDPSPRGGRL